MEEKFDSKKQLISKFMDKEHAFLDEVWDLFFQAPVESLELKNLFEHFQKNILVHMEVEDNVLFPKINEHLGIDLDSGLTAYAKKDHLGIKKLLSFLGPAILNGKTDKILEIRKNLDVVLKKHRDREREIHYPVSDLFITEEEWRQISGKLRHEN